MKVLFVCTGNTCRSPMCEAYLKSLGGAGLEIESAGACAAAGSPASDAAVAVIREFGGSLESFRSRQLTREMLEAADLIVPMTGGHWRRVVQLCPAAAEKTRLLLEFDPERRGGDVADPFGGSFGIYRHCFEEMRPALDQLWRKLQDC